MLSCAVLRWCGVAANVYLEQGGQLASNAACTVRFTSPAPAAPLDTRNAGTDAGIWIEVIGDKLTSGRQALLDSSKDTFERAQVDDFKVQCRNLGPLKAVRVWHDGKGTPWHLDMIVITLATGGWWAGVWDGVWGVHSNPKETQRACGCVAGWGNANGTAAAHGFCCRCRRVVWWGWLA